MMPNAWIPWGQWLAVIAMTAEHLARFVLPDAWGLAPWATLVGRIAFPLFAAMVAWHAVHNTRDPLGYALRMLAIALIAQLPYALVLDTERLNVVFTLALGLLIAVPLVASRWGSLVLGLGYAIAATFIAPALEYGVAGLLLVPAFVLAFRPCPAAWRPLLALPALVIGYQLNPGLLLNLVSLATVLAILGLLVRCTGHLTARLRPMPRALWLSWYPLHFAVIAVIHTTTTVAG
ncbi:TraX family protein [Halomonas koreensis]|uniref:TraX family protein n=1 Tax=Halomonas koreensis TaxID=245385 RepID=A0ABU1FX58_9GAMM|nr:TraX family protein [Halomonas koreensis]MDR5865271.1 TraX family protein [Halomonas koreensis]